jgi:hypothetical protein
MVSPFSFVYGFQAGNPPPFGLPVLMKLKKDLAILVDKDLGLLPPPVCVNMRSVL